MLRRRIIGHLRGGEGIVEVRRKTSGLRGLEDMTIAVEGGGGRCSRGTWESPIQGPTCMVVLEVTTSLLCSFPAHQRGVSPGRLSSSMHDLLVMIGHRLVGIEVHPVQEGEAQCEIAREEVGLEPAGTAGCEVRFRGESQSRAAGGQPGKTQTRLNVCQAGRDEVVPLDPDGGCSTAELHTIQPALAKYRYLAFRSMPSGTDGHLLYGWESKTAVVLAPPYRPIAAPVRPWSNRGALVARHRGYIRHNPSSLCCSLRIPTCVDKIPALPAMSPASTRPGIQYSNLYPNAPPIQAEAHGGLPTKVHSLSVSCGQLGDIVDHSRRKLI
nr:hypothetical protein CFP56_46743 [Quercus suber]